MLSIHKRKWNCLRKLFQMKIWDQIYPNTKVKISTLMRSGNAKKNRERLAVARSISQCVAKEQCVPVGKLYTVDVLMNLQWIFNESSMNLQWLFITLRWLFNDSSMTLQWLFDDFAMTLRWLLSINLLASFWHILSLFSPILSRRWLEMQMIVRTDFAFELLFSKYGLP